jgi:hypothetical protein
LETGAHLDKRTELALKTTPPHPFILLCDQF